MTKVITPKDSLANTQGMRKYKNHKNMYKDRVEYDDEPFRVKTKHKPASKHRDGIAIKGKTKGVTI